MFRWLDQLWDEIEVSLYKKFILNGMGIDYDKLTDMKYEVIARLLTLTIREYPDSILYSNINKMTDEKYKDKDIDTGNFIDITDSKKRKYYREEKKLRKGHINDLKVFESLGILFPNELEIESTRKGRNYDKANLTLIASDFYLLDAVINNRITCSHKISNEAFANIYYEFDKMYEDAKKCEDKLEYIIMWINFHRLETKMHFSLIPKIADCMLEKDDIPMSLFKYFWESYFTQEFFPKYNIIERFVLEPYQILRYDKYIKFFRDGSAEKHMKDIENERKIESAVCVEFYKSEKDYFKSFYEGNEDAIDEIYNFCYNIYPVIESHESSNFYLDENLKKVNKPKIRHARKVFEEFFPEEILQERLKKGTD